MMSFKNLTMLSSSQHWVMNFWLSTRPTPSHMQRTPRKSRKWYFWYEKYNAFICLFHLAIIVLSLLSRDSNALFSKHFPQWVDYLTLYVCYLFFLLPPPPPPIETVRHKPDQPIFMPMLISYFYSPGKWTNEMKLQDTHGTHKCFVYK